MPNLRHTVLLLVCMLMIVGLTTTASADPTPVITDCSSGTIYAAAGETVTLFVEADSNANTFMWQAISDHTLPENDSRYTAVYSFTMTPELHRAYLHCRVSYDRWYYTHSKGVYLALPEFTITQQPEGAELVIGMEARTSIKATGDQISYQWYCSYEKGDYTPLSCTGPEISMILNKAGDYRVYCQLTDKSGQTRKSLIAYFTAYAPVSVKRDVADAHVHSGAQVALDFWVEGVGVTCQWYCKKSDSSTFSKVSGETNPYYYFTMDTTYDGGKFYCIATDAAGNTVRSRTATATIDTSLSLRGDCSICGGDGNCNRCGGRGWYWADSRNPFAPHDQVDCDAELCNLGHCMGCGGDGWIGSPGNAKAGDANKDSKVNRNDVLLILQHLAGWDVTINKQTADVNANGMIETIDAVRVLQYVADK